MSENKMVQEEQEISALELLLGDGMPNVKKEAPTASYEVERLSEAAGKPVVFKLQALPYGRVQDLRRMSEDSEVNILLAGCVSPDLKDSRMMEKYGGVTPGEMVKNLLLPGEIADLSIAVERLCGYRKTTINEVKNG